VRRPWTHHRFTRRAGSGLLAVAAVAGTATMLSAAPASALSWHCSKSSHTIDTANYSGPWPDNWKITVQNCAARSGSYVYGKATIKWDGPTYYNTGPNIFDGAKYRLVLKKSVAGTDPTVAKKDYDIEEKLEANPGSGSYTTGTIKAKVNRTKAYADGTLLLDWHQCCGGYKSWGYAASPKA
jgi:hypothetical protein